MSTVFDAKRRNILQSENWLKSRSREKSEGLETGEAVGLDTPSLQTRV